MQAGLVTDTVGDKTPRHRVCEALLEADSASISGFQAHRVAERALWEIENDSSSFTTFLAGIEVLFLDVPVPFSYTITRQALKHGVHVFLETRSLPSLNEAGKLDRLAEESGVEVGVSRPLRYHDMFRKLPAEWRSTLTLIRITVSSNDSVQTSLEEAVDLCCFLSGSAEVQRLDAQAARGEPAAINCVAVSLRYQNGSYAQIQVRQANGAGEFRVFASSLGFQLDEDLLGGAHVEPGEGVGENVHAEMAFQGGAIPADDIFFAETEAFVEAVRRGKPARNTIGDAMRVQRILEDVQKKLR